MSGLSPEEIKRRADLVMSIGRYQRCGGGGGDRSRHRVSMQCQYERFPYCFGYCARFDGIVCVRNEICNAEATTTNKYWLLLRMWRVDLFLTREYC